MALSATSLYYLSADQLRVECSARELSASGPVRELRRHLTQYIKNRAMGGVDVASQDQASGPVEELDRHNSVSNNIETKMDQTPVFLEMLKHVPHLSSEEPEDILNFFVRLEEIHSLDLVGDECFITRIFPLVPRRLFQLLAECLRDKVDWVNCRVRILDAYFPYFVRERLVRNLIVFNFHERGQSVREYIDRVFQAAEFLLYEASEAQLVERIIMNLHPDVLRQAAFLDKPTTQKELRRVINLVEERIAIADERRTVSNVSADKNVSNGFPGNFQCKTVGPNKRRVINCWHCGRTGHFRKNCFQRHERSNKRKFLSSFQRVVGVPTDAPLWTLMELKSGKVPALLDTGAQFSCVRSEVAEFLHLAGEPCTFKQCSVKYVLADGTPCEVTRVMKLHVKLLGFSWDQEFKVLNGGPFPVILGLDFMRRTQMSVNIAAKTFQFSFAPHLIGQCGNPGREVEKNEFLQNLVGQLSEVSIQGGTGSRVNFESLAVEFPGLFSSVLGTAVCAPYEIELLDAVPVRSPPYRCAPPKAAIFKRMVNELLEQGVVRPSKSPYASPAFLVPKRDGGYRMVVDYRKVNTKVVFDSYPMPTIEQALDQFGGAVVFSVLDLNSAYYQIPLSRRSRCVTAFCTPFGLFEFNKLPMGISVGCQGLSRVIDELFSDLKGECVFNFVDDLVVYSASMEEHHKHVREVLHRLQRGGFTLNPDKVVFGASEIKYLGHLISSRGVSVLPDRIKTIQQYPPPNNLRALRRFMGMVGFYARFIPGYSDIAAALHSLKRKGVTWVWGQEQQKAFEELKHALCEAPVLQIPNFSRDFVLTTDASDVAVSAVLQQRIDGSLLPISYHSRILSPAERGYSTYEKECLGVIFGCEKCRIYLEHKPFELQCDNLALCWLLKRVKDVGRLGRWILRLSPFKFTVTHTRGIDNVVADALSRMFEGHSPEDPAALCGMMMNSLPLVYSSLKEHQDNDEFCKDLRGGIERKDNAANKFQIHNQLLCYFPRGARRRRYVVPVSLKGMVIKYFHDGILAGHLGARKTLSKISSNLWWVKMREDVFKYVQQCELCQRAKPAQNTRVGFHSAKPSSYPMERLFIDFVGPLVRSKRGNIAILVVVDAFSKFANFYPVRNITSRVVLECLERRFFSAYGTPKSVVTDNARVFCCKSFRDMCFRWGIQHITITPYYPQASLAERVNRNLKSALKIFHHQSQRDWDEDLPWVSTAFNTAVHESTQATPDILFLGREMKCPLAVRWDLSPVYSGQIRNNDPNFWSEVYARLKRASSKVARRYNEGRKPHNFQVGDTVRYRLKLISSKPHGISAKMMLRWSEPCVVLKEIRPNVVLLGRPDTGAVVRRAHVSQLKGCVL